MTQKYLGLRIGYQESTADVRIAQYESGTRKPKDDLVESIAYVLEVSPLALKVPDIDSYVGLMHTLFTLEDIYGLTIEKKDGKTVFRFDSRKGNDAERISKMVDAWLNGGEVSRRRDQQRRIRQMEIQISRI
jgi:hypothetical protein